MQPNTEEFLNFLLWSTQRLLCPVYRRVDGSSFESWAYRKGLRRQLRVLQASKLIEVQQNARGERLYRLTEAGRLHALGGRDPVARWSRKWDGRWRLVVFDVPNSKNNERVRLRRYLHDRGFGFLQKSLWVTPDPLEEEKSILQGGTVNVQTLVLLDATACAGEADEQIVAGAWDFEEINARYAAHVRFLSERPPQPLDSLSAAEALRVWAQKERHAWIDAVASDPLLPDCLLPPGYLGKKAWQARTEHLGVARDQLERFKAGDFSQSAQSNLLIHMDQKVARGCTSNRTFL